MPKNKTKTEELGDRVRFWYESYEPHPPWSSVLAFMSREINKAKKKQREEILGEIEKMKLCNHEVSFEYICKKCSMSDEVQINKERVYNQALQDILKIFKQKYIK